jgi:hypothetical protein
MREAVEATQRTIERRARLYRNLVVLVLVLGVGAPLVALLSERWMPLVGLIAIPLSVSAYLILDTLEVRRWKRRVDDFCRQRAISTEEFILAAQNIRHLPSATLHGMLIVLKRPSSSQALPRE